jgi:hypothetical protein
MGEYTLVDCETGLIYGPYETCAMARDHAEAKGIATWEIITGDERLIDWRGPQRTRSASDGADVRHRAGAASPGRDGMPEQPILIDILQMELDTKAPHWLSPPCRQDARRDEIRAKNRAKYVAKQKAKAAKAKADRTNIGSPSLTRLTRSSSDDN